MQFLLAIFAATSVSAAAFEPLVAAPPAQQERAALKTSLLTAAAACQRGFGATKKDRERIGTILEKLAAVSPTPIATSGIDGADVGTEPLTSTAPLAGCWRLVYTTASDVLSLDASPVAGVGAVYQLIEPETATELGGSSVTNIIDLYPRPQTLLPPGTLASALRLRVMTSAVARSADRVGLTFYAARAEPRALLGFDVSALLPALGGPLPRLPGNIGTRPDTLSSPSFFDVTYVDDELLCIRQNSPGGVFAAVRVDAAELEESAL